MTLYDRICTTARQHGVDSDPEHEIGDLQDVLQQAMKLLTPQQLEQLSTWYEEYRVDVQGYDD